jgi:hypothetical protein
MVVVDVLALTSLQRDLPRNLLSRVIGILETAVLSAALAASFAVATLIREVGLTGALLIVGLGFPLIAATGIRALVRAESRTALTGATPAPAGSSASGAPEALISTPALVSRADG